MKNTNTLEQLVAEGQYLTTPKQRRIAARLLQVAKELIGESARFVGLHFYRYEFECDGVTISLYQFTRAIQIKCPWCNAWHCNVTGKMYAPASRADIAEDLYSMSIAHEHLRIRERYGKCNERR